MKKLLCIILTFLYIASSTGATIQLHYCKGKLVDINLFNSQAGTCSKCGNCKKSSCTKSCCKYEQQTIRAAQHQKATAGNWQIVTPEAVITQQVPDHSATPIQARSTFTTTGNAPPRSHQTPLHILHCHFRL